MPSSGTDPTYGSPVFPETNGPAFGTDLTEVARYAGRGGPFRPGTTTERTAAAGAEAREGVYWSDTTNGELYRRTGGSWVLVPGARPVFAHAGKIDGFQSMAGGQVATIALQDSVGGFTLNSNALVVPVAGRYQVTARLYYSGSAGGPALGVLQVNEANRMNIITYKMPGSEGDTTVTENVTLLLAAGDRIRLWSNYGIFTYGETGYNGLFLEALRIA